MEKKPDYILKAETGYLKARRPKIKGARVVNASELIEMTKSLLMRLDATTAYLVRLDSLNKEAGIGLDEFELQNYIADNMAALDQFRGDQPDGKI